MTNLTKLSHLFLVFWSLFINSAFTQAADLIFTPADPVVEVGKQITLSVSGTIGEVTWSAQQGWPDPPTGTQVTYNAPSNPKKLEDVVTVSDEAGNVAILKVKLTTLPLENLNWETFTDPGTLKDMVLSQDGKTLWVLTGDNTGCGPDIVREPSIEQRDANTGKLKRRFTTSTSSDGFPKSECPYILLGANDEQLWLGTCDQGLAYYDSYTGKWTVYNKDSGLPDNQITSLLSDGSGGLWVNTPNGLAYRNNNKQWRIFNTENSNLPSNEIQGVWIDKNEGGLWIETTGLKLTYLNPVTEELMVYNTDNTGVTFNLIQKVVSDGHGGLWMQMIDYSESKTEEECYEDYDGCAWEGDEVCYPVSTSQEKGIAHLSKNGKWDVFTTINSKLSGDNIRSMISDQAGGLWIWTDSESEPLKYLNASYEWTTLGVTGNSPIVEIISDDKGGLWVVREGNIVHLTNTSSEWTTPELTVGVIIKIISDGKGGLWVVRRGSEWNNGGDVVHITNTQQVTTFPYQETSLLGRTEMRLLVRDDNEGLWIGTDQGLVHLSSDGTFNTPNPLPFFEGTIANDGNGGLWMWDLELSHFANEGETVSFNQLGDLLAHLGLPSNNIYTLANDDKGGLWIGTDNGLAYLTQTGQWSVFTAQNSALPSNLIKNVISHQSELWVGTDKGLVHLDGSGVVTVYNTDNSDLPDNDISTLLSDGNQGIWVGTNGGGLAHLTNEQWTMFSTENSSLPDNSVHALVSDDNGGIWIGTSSGLVHLNSNQEMTIFNSDNSQLPASGINALLSDGQGGLWVGTYTGLAHLIQPRNQWKIFNMDNSVLTLASDGNGGLWIGTYDGGLTHFDGKRQWTNFSEDNSDLPGDHLNVITNDGKGGLWIGISTENGGLVHFDGDKQWNVYNAVNMSVSFLNDGHGGIWIGTRGAGLTHLSANGEWKVFDTTSGLPDNFVYSLTSDGQGGIWLGTKSGLVHFTSNEEWEFFNTDNSDLPDNSVSVVASDVHGEVWMIIGSDQWEGKVVAGKLVHRKANGEWKIFSNNENSYGYEFLISDGKGGVWVEESYGEPDDYLYHINKDDELLYTFDSTDNSFDCYGSYGVGINSFTSDGLGGIWIGGSEEEEYRGLGCLTHVSNNHEITNLDVSLLSSSAISNLTNDDNGGVWIETNEGGGNMTEYYGGFNHLTVGRKQSGNRAAIIVAGGGNQEENSLWKPTESIVNYLYKMLLTRKFVNEEIYYLSPLPFADVTGDGGDDHVVDAPVPARQLVTEDIRLALEWAKKRGPLDQPLYLFFIDHGGPGQLQLAPLTYLEAADVDNWLDDYQTTTGNQVILVIDACYSGSFLQPLQAPNRAIITSAATNELAYFYDEEGFSRFFIKRLWQGRSFQEAFEYARSEQNKMVGGINQRSAATTTPDSSAQISQTPQLDDDGNGSYDNTTDGKWLRQVQVNGNVKTGDFTLAVDSLTTATTLIIGESLPLRVKAGTVTEPATEVWAVIRPPRMNLIMDTSGIPRLAFPKILLSKTSEKSIWETSWNQAIYNGDYEVTFYAKDSQGNIASSDSITITVTGGVEPPSQTTVQVQLNQTQYRRGEHLVATLTEDLNWGYDLYAAIKMPDETTVLSLKNTGILVPVDFATKSAEKWTGQRTQHSPITLLDLDLPDTLPTGQYCLFGILSPEGGEVFETLSQGLWVMDSQCFEIF